MKNPHVLLVEDDENDVLFMQHAFERAGAGHRLQVVYDGTEAIEYLFGEGKYADRSIYPTPGLLLLDLNMPRKTGFEVLQHVRQDGSIWLPVIVVTASTADADMRRAFESGASGYVVKPSAPLELRDFVEAVLHYWTKWNDVPGVLPASASSSIGEATRE